MKPTIVYIDDEPRNLTVFEASIPEDWQVICYDNALEALKKIKEINPWVIISDQKMPQMSGLEFLEVAAQLVPEAIRIIVTGQTEEQTIIQLVRRAKIFDYLTKPWETEILISQIQKALDYYRLTYERKKAVDELQIKADLLEKANTREIELRNEIGAWAPAPIVLAINQKTLKLPAERDLALITYDIIDSSSLHGTIIQNKTVQNHVQRLFIECLAKLGGLKEAASGDSVYGHFGAVSYPEKPHDAALFAAQEFRVALRSFSKIHNVKVECGIALHHAPRTLIDIHEVKFQTARGPVIQKWFDTSSVHVDLVHRIEKYLHELPGSSLVMTQEYLAHLSERPARTESLGYFKVKGSENPVELFILASDHVTPESLQKLKAKYGTGEETNKVAA